APDGRDGRAAEDLPGPAGALLCRRTLVQGDRGDPGDPDRNRAIADRAWQGAATGDVDDPHAGGDEAGPPWIGNRRARYSRATGPGSTTRRTRRSPKHSRRRATTPSSRRGRKSRTRSR